MALPGSFKSLSPFMAQNPGNLSLKLPYHLGWISCVPFRHAGQQSSARGKKMVKVGTDLSWQPPIFTWSFFMSPKSGRNNIAQVAASFQRARPGLIRTRSRSEPMTTRVDTLSRAVAFSIAGRRAQVFASASGFFFAQQCRGFAPRVAMQYPGLAR